MLRVYYSESLPERGTVVELSKEESHHLVRVRRAKAGDLIELLDGCGNFGIGELISVSGKRISARIESVDHQPKPAVQVRLFLAFPKSKVFEAVLQKAVELGVTEIVPMATDHADPAMSKADEPSRRERWQQILVEAMKQSGNRHLPSLLPIRSLAEVLHDDPSAKLRLCAALQEGSGSLWEILREEVPGQIQQIDLFVGPEGDFSIAEYALLSECCRFFTLGGPVLRVETAAVSALAVVQEALRVLGRR